MLLRWKDQRAELGAAAQAGIWRSRYKSTFTAASIASEPLSKSEGGGFMIKYRQPQQVPQASFVTMLQVYPRKSLRTGKSQTVTGSVRRLGREAEAGGLIHFFFFFCVHFSESQIQSDILHRIPLNQSHIRPKSPGKKK